MIHPAKIPTSLADAYEVFTGLKRLGKPVALYYYPQDGHQPTHPAARLATLERNIDWYRFWLMDIEDTDPTKRDQYSSWNRLKTEMPGSEVR